MTTTEVFKQIISEHKWYAPYMSAQAAFLFKKRFVKGELKHSTINRWFAKFGYEQNEVTWKKSHRITIPKEVYDDLQLFAKEVKDRLKDISDKKQFGDVVVLSVNDKEAIIKIDEL